MQLLDAYPLIVTQNLAAVRDFYVRWFGCEVGFEASWFIWLTLPGERPFSLAFMRADHPSNPPGPETFDGKGMILTFQVADAAAEFARLNAAGLPMVYGLHDELWGQRRFMVQDPAGVCIDVVEQTEPAAGFWQQYQGA